MLFRADAKYFTFFKASKPLVGPIQPHILWVHAAVSQSIKQPERESDHLYPFGADGYRPDGLDFETRCRQSFPLPLPYMFTGLQGTMLPFIYINYSFKVLKCNIIFCTI